MFGVALLLVLRFDGSYNAATKIGASSAVIFRAGGEVPIALGARVGRFESSADSEYGGLLLGLGFLVRNHEVLASTARSQCSISVQGDCKTVIAQMQNRSHARRLYEPCCQAHDATRLLSKTPCGRSVDITFDLIPRADNFLADQLADEALRLVRQARILTCRNLMQERHFQSALIAIAEDNCIERTAKLPLLLELLQVVEAARDMNAMLAVALSIQKIASTAVNVKHFRASGILAEARALALFGKDAESLTLLQRHRYTLRSKGVLLKGIQDAKCTPDNAVVAAWVTEMPCNPAALLGKSDGAWLLFPVLT